MKTIKTSADDSIMMQTLDGNKKKKRKRKKRRKREKVHNEAQNPHKPEDLPQDRQIFKIDSSDKKTEESSVKGDKHFSRDHGGFPDSPPGFELDEDDSSTHVKVSIEQKKNDSAICSFEQVITTDTNNSNPIRLGTETSMATRKIDFVFPKNKNSGNKLVSYVHSKLKSTTMNVLQENVDKHHKETGDIKSISNLKEQDIDDILFPQRKRNGVEDQDDSKVKDENIKIDCTSNKKEMRMASASGKLLTIREKNSDNFTLKAKTRTTAADNISLKTKVSTTKSDEQNSQLEPKKMKEKDSKNKQPGEPKLGEVRKVKEDIVQSRCRSDSLNDPTKVRLSGRTVEDAVRDKSGRRPRSNSTDGELNLPKRGLCDERVVIQNYKWNNEFLKKRVPPRGFVNLGNTCFLNATLQCLAYLPTFCQCVANLSSVPSGKKKSNGQKVTMHLKNLLRSVHGLDGDIKHSPYTPAIARSISLLGGGNHGYKFRQGRQEDAHEFLVHLLDAMNDGELKAAGIDQNKSGWRDDLPISRLDETTLTHRMFGGYLRSQVRCTKCKYNSNTYDPFLDLSLEVSGKKVGNIHDALAEFTRKETLDAANKWKCSGCKKKVCATKQLTIFRPPLTLCIQLKRFSFGSGFGGFMHHQGYGHFSGKGMGMRKGGSKIQKSIEFPATMKLPLSDGRKCEYVLTGVVIHVGGCATSGHYTAFVRRMGTPNKSEWLNMDDSFVDSVSEKTVLRHIKDAYVLFYCRKEVQLELPLPPPRSYSNAKEAVKAVEARARARSDSWSETSAKKTMKDKHIFDKEESDKIKPLHPNIPKDDKKELTKRSDPCVTTKPSLIDCDRDDNEIPMNGLPNSNKVLSTEETKSSDRDDKTLSPAIQKNSNKVTSKERKRKDFSVDLGSSRGVVKVKLAKKKKKKAWKPSVHEKSAANLLGNAGVSKWDNEGDNEETDARTKLAKKKDLRLREKVFEETNLKNKDRKRKMYLDGWDAGLDAGRTKKVKIKDTTKDEDLYPKENPFHRIQQSMLAMKRGKAKGHQITSMKKRRLKLKR